MISVTAVYGAATVAYGVALVVLLAWLTRIDEARRRYCYLVVAVVGIATVATALSALGVGAISGVQIDLPSVFDDLIAYSVLWVVTGLLVDESKRMLGLLALIPAIQVVSFNVASIVGGVVGLVGLFVVVAGHGVIAYLLLGPIWERAERVPEKQRLLHWKSRNLLLFLIGMLIAFALLSVGNVFDAFVIAVLSEYISFLIRVGFAGFLFANADAIGLDRSGFTERVSGSADRESLVDGAD